MSLTETDRKLLKNLVKNELAELKETGKTVFIVEDHPGFLAGEEKYEDFLETLLKKL